MKLLRQIIRQIILEGPVKDAFDESWYNTDEKRNQFKDAANGQAGTHHPDSLKDNYVEWHHDDIDDYFDDKRDLKRMWNEIIDQENLRAFWEGPKMKYFHSLAYYGNPKESEEKLATDVDSDEEIKDLSSWGFFQLYDKDGNKDEMSTFGIYNGQHQINEYQQKFGVLISGRVTLATQDDAFTESRSKAKKSDLARHAPSGLPKRIAPTDDKIQSLLFEEEDIVYFNNLGECILDNWSIEAIVCSTFLSDSLIDAAQDLADQYGVPLITPKDLGQQTRTIK